MCNLLINKYTLDYSCIQWQWNFILLACEYSTSTVTVKVQKLVCNFITLQSCTDTFTEN